MYKLITTSLFASAIIFLLSCQDDEQAAQPEQSVSIDGYVQKGPFINGTAITVSELDQELVATGKNFTTQIIDNKGAFSLRNITLQSDFVQLIAEGFYFDEVRGEKSAAQLTLLALADVSNVSSVNVNLLSHLEKDRVTYLMQKEEKSFATAKQQAQREILAIFGIEKTDMAASELLDISQEGEDNAILLAISAILQGNNSVAELSELLANIITDIREDGVLDSESTGEKIRTNATLLTLVDIRQHLEARYEELGVNATIPNFEQYVDSDGDGFLNKDEDDTPDEFTFEAQVDVAVDTSVISNEVVISGLKEGGKTVAQLKSGKLVDSSLAAPDDSVHFANLTNGARLLVNGQTTKNRTTAQVGNGDRVRIALQSSDETATVKRASLKIGSINRIFEVTTDDYVPSAFNFISVTNAKRDSLYTSESIVLADLPHITSVHLDNGSLLINGQLATDNQGSVREGDEIALRLLASSEYNVEKTSSIQIGATSKTFKVYTALNPWQKKADLPIEDFYKKRSFVVGDNIYIIDFSNSSIYIYLADQDRWTQKSTVIPSEFEEERSNLLCFTIRDKAYIGLGGYTENLFDETQEKVVHTYRDFWEYDPAANSWVRKADFPGENVNGATSFILDSKAYIVSGYYDDLSYENDYNADYLYTKQTWKYDPDVDQWAKVADFPGETRQSAAGLGFDGVGYLGGGRKGYIGVTVNGFWKYNPVSDNWIKQTKLDEEFELGNYNGSCAFFSSNSALHFITAYNGEKYFKRYDAIYDVWRDLELPESLWSIGVLSNEKKTYILNPQYEAPFGLWEYISPQD